MGRRRKGELQSGFRADQIKRDGDLRQNPTMLRRHYRSEDRDQGAFKASGRNLARSDLKCRVRDGMWDRRAAESGLSAACHLRIRPASYTQCHNQTSRTYSCCTLMPGRVALANTLLGFKGPEVELMVG